MISIHPANDMLQLNLSNGTAKPKKDPKIIS